MTRVSHSGNDFLLHTQLISQINGGKNVDGHRGADDYCFLLMSPPTALFPSTDSDEGEMNKAILDSTWCACRIANDAERSGFFFVLLKQFLKLSAFPTLLRCDERRSFSIPSIAKDVSPLPNEKKMVKKSLWGLFCRMGQLKLLLFMDCTCVRCQVVLLLLEAAFFHSA